MDATCASNLEGLVPAEVRFPASSWLQTQAIGLGLSSDVNFTRCNVPYSGQLALTIVATPFSDTIILHSPTLVSLDVSLLSGNDDFKLQKLADIDHNITAPVTVTGNNGSKSVLVNCHAQPCVTLITTSNEYADNVTLYAPIAGSVDVGQDTESDNITVLYGPTYPQMPTALNVLNLTASGEGVLKLVNVGEGDTVSMLQGDMSEFADLNMKPVNPEVLRLQWNQPFRTLRWELQNNTHVHLRDLSPKATVSYIIASTNNFTLDTALPSTSFLVSDAVSVFSISVPTTSNFVINGSCPSLRELTFVGSAASLSQPIFNVTLQKPLSEKRLLTLNDSVVLLEVVTMLQFSSASDVSWTYNVHAEDGLNKLSVDQTTATSNIFPYADARLDLRLPLGRSVALPGNELAWNARQHTVHSNAGLKDQGCLQPSRDCSEQLYKRRAIEHSQVCHVAQSECKSLKPHVFIYWTSDLVCDANTNGAMLKFETAEATDDLDTVKSWLVFSAFLHYGGFLATLGLFVWMGWLQLLLFFATYAMSLLINLHGLDVDGQWDDRSFNFLEAMYESAINGVTFRSNDCPSNDRLKLQDATLHSCFIIQVVLTLSVWVTIILRDKLESRFDICIREVRTSKVLLAINLVSFLLLPSWIIPATTSGTKQASYAAFAGIIGLFAWISSVVVRYNVITQQRNIWPEIKDYMSQRPMSIIVEWLGLLCLYFVSASVKPGALRTELYVASIVAFLLTISVVEAFQLQIRSLRSWFLTIPMILIWAVFLALTVILSRPARPGFSSLFTCCFLLVFASWGHICVVFMARRVNPHPPRRGLVQNEDAPLLGVDDGDL
eukprot:TRINITY_DN9865_c0_g2_i1.p1 TRINITY_DN9865_c0_g2~~TRINITY_DN9865_c0_g2_i1.p1  ORF type:complete len:854 (+),score=66.01 TRINITY_DN9865_c0_g2_i1:58-2562(+)